MSKTPRATKGTIYSVRCPWCSADILYPVMRSTMPDCPKCDKPIEIKVEVFVSPASYALTKESKGW